MLRKKTEEMNSVELQLQDALEAIEELENRIRKLDLAIDGIFSKAAMSHSLLVVRKVDENNLSQLDELLD